MAASVASCPAARMTHSSDRIEREGPRILWINAASNRNGRGPKRWVKHGVRTSPASEICAHPHDPRTSAFHSALVPAWACSAQPCG